MLRFSLIFDEMENENDVLEYLTSETVTETVSVVELTKKMSDISCISVSELFFKKLFNDNKYFAIFVICGSKS